MCYIAIISHRADAGRSANKGLSFCRISSGSSKRSIYNRKHSALLGTRYFCNQKLIEINERGIVIVDRYTVSQKKMFSEQSLALGANIKAVKMNNIAHVKG